MPLRFPPGKNELLTHLISRTNHRFAAAKNKLTMTGDFFKKKRPSLLYFTIIPTLFSLVSLTLSGSNTIKNIQTTSSTSNGPAAQNTQAVGYGGGYDSSEPSEGFPSHKKKSAAQSSPSLVPPPSEVSPASSRYSHNKQLIKNMGIPSVALTFDDGPDTYTPQILDLLRQYKVKATFCVIGVNVKAYPHMLQQIVSDGHSLCNHTWDHDLALGTRSYERIRADLQRTHDAIHSVVPHAPINYFRHPGGNFTPAAISVADEMGMDSIGWDVDPRDWDRRMGTGNAISQHIINVIMANTHAGSIILSHDGGGDRTGTLQAYQVLLPWLTAHFPLVPLQPELWKPL